MTSNTPISMAAALLLVFPLALEAQEELDRLHRVLQSGESSTHEKAIACERLAEVGNEQSVPLLAALLDDQRLSHYARFGLEAIPAAAVDEAFREALGELSGKHLIGVINSIGQRQDAEAVERLTGMLRDTEPPIRAAAAAALGQIANQRAVDALLHELGRGETPQTRAAIADACLAAAESLLERQRERALAVYDAVRRSDSPAQIRIAATYSAILARGSADLTLLHQQFQAGDDELFEVALQAAKQLPGDSVTEALVDQFNRQQPHRQVIIITALSERKDKAALPALRDAARSDSDAVRRAAIRGLAQLQDSASAGLLLFMLSDANPAVAAEARRAIAELPGDHVDEMIVSQLDQATAQRLEDLIALAGVRRIAAAISSLKRSAASPEDSVRQASINALGEIATLEDLDFLAQRALHADTPEDRQAAAAALTAACVRIPDREGCVKTVVAQFSGAPPEGQFMLFELLREVGGRAALETVVAGARDGSDATQDAASRVLGEWLTVDAAPELLELARSSRSEKYQVRALRGYIRIIRQFGLPLQERVAMARRALEAAKRSDERVLVLQALPRFPAPESLQVAAEQLSRPGLKHQAAQAAVNIAEKLSEEDRQKARAAMQAVVNAGVGAGLKARAAAVLKETGS